MDRRPPYLRLRRSIIASRSKLDKRTVGVLFLQKLSNSRSIIFKNLNLNKNVSYPLPPPQPLPHPHSRPRQLQPYLIKYLSVSTSRLQLGLMISFRKLHKEQSFVACCRYFVLSTPFLILGVVAFMFSFPTPIPYKFDSIRSYAFIEHSFADRPCSI